MMNLLQSYFIGKTCRLLSDLQTGSDMIPVVRQKKLSRR